MMKCKKWVSELSDRSQKELFAICENKLIEYGYSKKDIKVFMFDLSNEKLTNLDNLISYEKMLELSNK